MTDWALHGGRSPAVVAAGHSHVLCQLQALHAAPRDWAAVAYTARLEDGPPVDEDYWTFVESIDSRAAVAIVWNGNQHHAQFLVEAIPPVAVWDPWKNGVSGTGRLIARSQFRALWEPTMAPLLEVLPTLALRHRVVLVGTPPPKRDDLVRSNLPVEKWFAPNAEALGIEIGELPITEQSTRLALWRLFQDWLAEIAGALGIEFMPVPATGADFEGFLRAELSAPDATHANALYGDLVWNALEAWYSSG